MGIAIAVAVASAILGSLLFQFLVPIDNIPQQIQLEEKCEKIATEGFQIQIKYSEINFDTMPKEDADALRYLDELWIRDCVSNLSGEKIFEIAKKAEDDYYSGE
ncbi:MAG TPA: hypothetical protein VMW74_02805 [Nitrosopumilaceae archaeon]|nr:hypothetical protein [Nitrosopumilaceae archaeon]